MMDVTGTWTFSVDLNNGQHGDPVFVLKQTGGRVTGTYQGPFGKHEVTGTVSDDTVTLEVSAAEGGRTLKLSYTGKIEGQEKMSGTMTRNISGQSTPGKWKATRSK